MRPAKKKAGWAAAGSSGGGRASLPGAPCSLPQLPFETIPAAQASEGRHKPAGRRWAATQAGEPRRSADRQAINSIAARSW